tara:strand:+ start:93514 stop:93930 length:417 start_codon:yes stop_codon:yes gene_type:complete
MNKLFLAVFFLAILGSSSIYASFINVDTVNCDGETVQNSEIERVYVDFNRAMFGIGKSESKCRVVDFYSVLTTTNSTSDGQQMIVFQPTEEVGRRSSCTKDLLPFAGISFEAAAFTGKKIILSNTEKCQALELSLEGQ